MKPQRGVTYLWMLFLIFLLSLALGKVLEVYSTLVQRQKEAELLYIGDTYREAIREYYLSSPGYQKKYPDRLNDLLKDPRYLTTRRYLRRLYVDPISNQAFLTIAAPQGGIMGVMSDSTKAPLKTGGFSAKDAGFSGSKQLSDWQFVYDGEPYDGSALAR